MSILYDAPKTCAEFMNSAAFVRIIMGPVGSGKTTALIMEILRRGIEQRPGPDGIRRTRWAIVRQTLSQMKMTILLDMLSWFRLFATYKVSEQLVTLEFNDVRIEVYLIPLEEEEDQKRLLSMQLTGCAMNECTELSIDLVSAISGRCGRFPSKAEGGPSWFGVIGDCNAPTEGSDWWKMMEEDRPHDWQIFRQPSGLSAEAENVENLPERYYERLAENPNADWVRRYVQCEYGEDPSGVAVFRDAFRRAFHTVENLEPVMGKSLIIGQDFGRSPCSVICQPDHRGRLLVLEEVLAEDIGLETHVSRSLKPALFSDRYAGHLFAAVGDPSGVAKGNFLEEDSFDVMRRLGIPAFPAPTNAIESRLAAVENLLFQQRDGGPAIVIDRSKCPMLVRALNGAYRYARNQAGLTKPLPEKLHPASDLADALQYVCLVLNSGIVDFIAKRIKPRQKKPVGRKVSVAGWT
ncbi:MAG TPA: DEAD/DEAH box helicase family protein [Terrimicrobiaceae bacterium]|nr:DEAD/DEAH box helicase family protein [Terrimicrobiaceae bacterium]